MKTFAATLALLALSCQAIDLMSMNVEEEDVVDEDVIDALVTLSKTSKHGAEGQAALAIVTEALKAESIDELDLAS